MALGTTRISQQTTRGFTLLEVIITVTIIAAVVTMVLPRIGGRSNEVRATVRKLAVLSRDLRSRAKLNNATYRLVIALSDEEGEEADKKKKQTYWVERAQGEVLNNYDPKDPPKLQSKEDKEKENERDADDKSPPPPFAPDPQVMKKPDELPADLMFESVELVNVKEPITTGIVYIHFLPNGYTDEAAIHLKRGEKVAWTLAIDPLTGRMDILDEFRKLEDLRAK